MIDKLYTLLLFISFWIIYLVSFFLGFLFRIFSFFRKVKKHKGQLEVLVLEAHPPSESGAHSRTYRWIPYLSKVGLSLVVKDVFEEQEYRAYTAPGTPKSKLAIKLLWIRFWQCLCASSYDVVIVRRELMLFFDYGGTFMEQFLLNVNNRVILDFDDDLTALKSKKSGYSFFGKLMLENRLKFSEGLKMYQFFSTSGPKLFGLLEHVPLSNVIEMPMCIETMQPTQFTEEKFSRKKMLWIGGANRLKYLESLTFDTLEEQYQKGVDFELIVLTKPGSITKPHSFPLQEIAWDNEIEQEWISKAHFGLAPYEESALFNLAGSYKTIQYLSYGCIPLTTDFPVLANHFRHGIDGFFVPNDQWPKYVEQILNMKLDEAIAFSKNAYDTASNKYSYDSKLSTFESLIKKVAQT